MQHTDKQVKGTKKISFKMLLLAVCLILFVAFSIIMSCNKNLRAQLFSAFNLSGEKAFDSDFSVHFIDVGQGDCALINNKDTNILIDTGDEIYSDKISRYIKSYGIKKLDYIIISHPHLDHIGGLIKIIQSFNVNNIIINDIPLDKCEKDYNIKNLYSEAFEKGINIIHPKNNDIMQISDLSLEFFNFCNYDNLNDSSLVVRIAYNNNKSFLFTGDIEKFSEAFLSENMAPCTVMKVAHHGSNTSSTKKFLDKVKPELCVICCGSSNTFGHPSDDVISRLSKLSSKILRTDLSGNIVMTIKDNKLIIKTEKSDQFAIS